MRVSPRRTFEGSPIYVIIYVSSAVRLFSDAELRALLKKSRENNARSGITGLLLYREGNFMQLLEGEKKAVEEKFERISRDPRHRGLIVLLRGEEPERHFADFSMGFRNLNSDAIRDLPGYNEFLNTPLTSQEFSGDLTRCRRLLLSFKRIGGPTDRFLD